MRPFGEDRSSGGVRERSFAVDVDGRTVPGVLWTPAPGPDGEAIPGADPPRPTGAVAGHPDAPGPRPLVLIGHGGSDHKRKGYVVSLARRLVRHHAVAALAIDGPVHGDRRPDRGVDDRLALLEFAQAWANDPTLTDTMVDDWLGALEAVQGLPDVGAGPVGYWGLSMGTILGLPLVAATPRIEVAVLGLMGLTGPSRDRIAAAAPAVRCPVLFLMQWDDELFHRDGALALFDALGSPDKQLHANPGAHGAVPEHEFSASEAFLAGHLVR